MFGGKGCAIGETDAISGIITTSNHQHAVHGSRLVTHNNVVYDGRHTSSTRGEIGGGSEHPNRRCKVSGNNMNTNNT